MKVRLASLAVLAFAMAGSPTHAAIVQVDSTVSLNESQIWNCLENFGVTEPRCWLAGRLPGGEFAGVTFPLTSLQQGDTLRLVVRFADGYRLRWADDGFDVPTYGDEFFQITFALDGEDSVQGNGIFANGFSFAEPTGSLLGNGYSWTWPGQSGGLGVASWDGGPVNLTDSFFEFSGFTAEFGVLSGTGIPATLNYYLATLGSGVFTIVAPVPIPQSAWLLATGCLALMGWGRGKSR